MQATDAIDTGILLAVAVVLVLAAIEDIRARRISNNLSLMLLGLFTVRAMVGIIAGHDILAATLWPLAVAAAVFLVGLALFAVRLMGGGDVKLLAAMALFAGPALGLSFVLYVTVLGGLVAMALWVFSRLRSEPAPNDTKVPYGVAISLGGLWVCFVQISALSN